MSVSVQVPFINREAELQYFDTIINEWDTRRVVCIQAEGGVGKTRLLREIYNNYAGKPPGAFQEYLDPNQRPEIALILQFARPEWNAEFVRGARAMANELGITLHIYDANFDTTRMVADLEQVIDNAPRDNPFAIIINEGTNEALRPALERAIQQNNKILTFDNNLHDIKGIVARVSQDDYRGAHYMLSEMVRAIGYRGKIATIYDDQFPPLQKRKDILDNVLKEYPDIILIAELKQWDETTSNHNTIAARVYAWTCETLRHSPDLKALWASSDVFARGAVQALIELKRNDVQVYSFDLCPSNIELMQQQDSPWKATIGTDPADNGRVMVRLAVLAAYGHEISPYYSLPMELLTQEDVRKRHAEHCPLWHTSSTGWTGWLRSLLRIPGAIVQQPVIYVTEVLDFDDHALHQHHNLLLKLADVPGRETFQPYQQSLADLHRMMGSGVSPERLKQESDEARSLFATCFNRLAEQRRTVILFDTFETVSQKEFWHELINLINQLHNTVVVLAGRPSAEEVIKTLREKLNPVQTITLEPLTDSAGVSYLRQKQDLLQVYLEPELVNKLLHMAGGRPILIDLAVEWRMRGISLNWLLDQSVDELKSLSDEELAHRRQEFEQQLVRHIAKTQQTTDWLILLMARVYPLNVEMIQTFLEVTKEEANDLYNEVCTFVFVKLLPDSSIKLHDEMRRLVLEYVWPLVDPHGKLRRRDSKLVIDYYDRAIERLNMPETSQPQGLSADFPMVAPMLEMVREREQAQKIWLFRVEKLHHSLVVDLAEGMRFFERIFDEATQTESFYQREIMLSEVGKYAECFSPAQRYEYESRCVKFYFDRARYAEARDLSTEILTRDLEPKQQVSILILRGNIEIRLGDIGRGIDDFAAALNLSEEHNLVILEIKSCNALGWAYRQRGQLDEATTYYRQALGRCTDENYMGEDYGLILNNMTFVLSSRAQTRQNAISYGHMAIEHWQTLNNDIGLALAHQALGVACYRNALYAEALREFEESLSTFERLDQRDNLAQVYSWRGAVYQDQGRLDEAEDDLQHSLELGSRNQEAMTRNRLGRVYMSRGNWEAAEREIEQSYIRAQEIADYTYWIVSLARLITIAVMRGQVDRLEEFDAKLRTFLDQPPNAEKNSLGIAYTGLARLALRRGQLEQAIDHFKKGISLLAEHGSYARADVLSRLKYIEREDFPQVSPDHVRQVGQTLKGFFREKEQENMAYGVVTSVMSRWVTWKQ